MTNTHFNLNLQLISYFFFKSLGNHEFDDGIDNLVEYLKHVKTPVVACNLNLTTEPKLNLPNLTPSKVLDVDGRKIGVIGYLTPDTMVITANVIKSSTWH